MSNYSTKKQLYKIVPADRGESSRAASFCRILGVITWIGGLIIAITSSNTAQINRFGSVEQTFSFTLFLTSIITYGIAGGVMLCVAELLENIQSIADSLKGLSVIGEDDTTNDAPASRPVPAANIREVKAPTLPKATEAANAPSEAKTDSDTPCSALQDSFTIISEQEIKCNQCGTIQPRWRIGGICFKCGTKFKA